MEWDGIIGYNIINSICSSNSHEWRLCDTHSRWQMSHLERQTHNQYKDGAVTKLYADQQ